MTHRPMKIALLVLACAASLPVSGCGGRAHLEDNQGLSFRRAAAAQRDARPRKGVAPATALEIKLATDNRIARLAATTGSPGGVTTGGYTSSAGMPATINPGSINLGGTPGATQGSELRLQGK